MIILSPCIPRVHLEIWINEKELEGYSLELITIFVVAQDDNWTGIAAMRKREQDGKNVGIQDDEGLT